MEIFRDYLEKYWDVSDQCSIGGVERVRIEFFYIVDF
jgi:hypothetical protein